jgi:hypothetical protein
VISHGSKFGEPQHINWKHNFKIIMNAVVKQELLNYFGATGFIPVVFSVVRVIQPVVFLCSFVDQCLSVPRFSSSIHRWHDIILCDRIVKLLMANQYFSLACYPVSSAYKQ